MTVCSMVMWKNRSHMNKFLKLGEYPCPGFCEFSQLTIHMQLLWNLVEVPLKLHMVTKKDCAIFKILEGFYFPQRDFNKMFASF